MQLPEAVKRKRARLYSQKECAKLLGVCRRTIQSIEGNERPVSVELLGRYLALMGWRIRIGPRNRKEA